MKFNDITNTTSPAKAARESLRRQNIAINETLSGRALRDELQKTHNDIKVLSSLGGEAYTRAILQKEIYEDMANVDVVLFETALEDVDIEQAEVIIAARSMNNDFQGMIEDVADMMGSDMITLIDQIKARFGDGAGEAYAQTVKTALAGAIETLTQTKDSLDAAISELSTGVAAPMVGDESDSAIFPSSAGPEEEPTGRELKSDTI